MKDSHVDAAMYELCENIDAWAMWISPPMFLIFNIAYWSVFLTAKSQRDPSGDPILVQDSSTHTRLKYLLMENNL